MNIEEVLLTAQSRGIVLKRDGGDLAWCGPAGAMTAELAAQIVSARDAILLRLSGQSGQQIAVAPGPLPLCFTAQGVTTLAAVHALLDQAARTHASNAARQRVIQTYRDVVKDYHARRDSRLFEALAEIETGLLARWQAHK